jgi:sugar phosphate isomerase/epimerase
LNPVAFSTLACPEWPADSVVANAAAYGYDAIEWRGGQNGHVSPALPAAERAGLKRRQHSAGLYALAVTAYSSFVSEHADEQQASLDDLRRHCDLAAELGAAFVRAFVGELPPGVRPEAVVARAAWCLAAAAEHAQSVGVAIALEPHDDFARSDRVAPILRQATHPALSVIWDIANAYAAGEDPADGLARLRPRLAYVQVKDGCGRGPDWRLTGVGQGEVPLQTALAQLIGGGYQGALSVEWERADHPELAPPEVALPAALRVLRQWLAEAAGPRVGADRAEQAP